jgi:hypothetical protein
MFGSFRDLAFVGAAAPPSIEPADPYFASVSLLLPFDGADGSTVFTDESSFNHTVNRINPAVITTTVNSVDGAALDTRPGGFAGVNNASIQSSLDFGSGDFTIEFTVFREDLDQAKPFMCVGDYTQFGNGFLLWSVGGLLILTDSRGNFHGESTFQAATLTRIAYTRENGIVRIFQDGNIVNSFANNRSYSPSIAALAGSNFISIGFVNFQNSINGFIDQVRITKGIARYTANYTPSLEPYPLQGPAVSPPLPDPGPTDPDFANVSLILRFDEANTSTRFIDLSPNSFVITRTGDAQNSTAEKKWGTSSLLLDGSGDSLLTPANAAFNLVGDFTVEMWVFPVVTTGNRTQLHIHSGGNRGIHIWFVGTSLVMDNGVDPGGFSEPEGTGSIVAGTWCHLRICKSGNTCHYFKDFALLASLPAMNYGTPDRVTIGRYHPGGTQDAHSYIDDLRITKGIARSTESFPPITGPFPIS